MAQRRRVYNNNQCLGQSTSKCFDILTATFIAHSFAQFATYHAGACGGGPSRRTASQGPRSRPPITSPPITSPPPPARAEGDRALLGCAAQSVPPTLAAAAGRRRLRLQPCCPFARLLPSPPWVAKGGAGPTNMSHSNNFSPNPRPRTTARCRWSRVALGSSGRWHLRPRQSSMSSSRLTWFARVKIGDVRGDLAPGMSTRGPCMHAFPSQVLVMLRSLQQLKKLLSSGCSSSSIWQLVATQLPGHAKAVFAQRCEGRVYGAQRMHRAGKGQTEGKTAVLAAPPSLLLQRGLARTVLSNCACKREGRPHVQQAYAAVHQAQHKMISTTMR